MDTSITSAISVKDIPRLDPPPACTPLAGLSDGGLPRVVLPSGHTAVHLTRYGDVHRVLKDPTFSRARANTDDGPSFLPTAMPPELLINLDAAHHARMRRVVANEYGAAAVERLRPALEEIIEVCFADLRSEEHPDVFRTVLDRIPAEVNARFLGLPAQDFERVRLHGRTAQMAPADDFDTLVEHFTAVCAYVTDLVTGVRPSARGGLVERLVAGRDRAEPPLTDAELTGLLLPAVVAGDHNSLSVLAKAVYALLCSPGLWQRLVADPAVAPRLTEELIRLIPLGGPSAFPRIATRDVETAEAVIHEGDVVYADVFAANRDPEVFPAPETIDPDREGAKHLQFGYGMHHCMGAALARLEITTVLVRLAQEFPRLALDADPETLPWDHGVLLRRPTALPVRW
ncbi:cytochrome P450 [Streptomyces lancefieldiae]|uniref:Cytochrome P450 n=1 Tax=Streptomyces lancefieldiae TaxID=3075520 RepID=A0ABU3B2Y8_9ACTN|nr:cytochrome P450 [Streptomyces sp. DSM 40712]MDT0615361.1 cytochrome P450 [Streptomyces sp. DSM 40712]